MNYKKIYYNVIDKARLRHISASEYYESHHIIPRCLDGKDNIENLVNLTAREHFIAHLCLVKMYPGDHRLVKAAVMMSCESNTQLRSGNRIYEWLRKKHSIAMSAAQAGPGNSQYGTMWIFNEDLQENKKIKTTDLQIYLEKGWHKGRVHDFSKIFQICSVCQIKFKSAINKQTCSTKCRSSKIEKFKLLAGKEEELKKFYEQTNSMNKALQLMGYPGAVGYYYRWAKSILDKKY